jgi:hypothetical protein
MMNDVTLKQIAAVRRLSAKGATSGYRTTYDDPPGDQFPLEIRAYSAGVCIKLLTRKIVAAFDQLSFLCSMSLSRTATFTSLHPVTILSYPLQMPRITPK